MMSVGKILRTEPLFGTIVLERGNPREALGVDGRNLATKGA